MNCPRCNLTLLMAERQGVEIDYCPQCRGIWLDRGELEKIIEGNMASINNNVSQGPYNSPVWNQGDYHDKHHDSDHDRNYNNTGPYGPRRKKGFLGEIFDF